MVKGFENISDAQFGILKDAIAWITVLIAGADGQIDPKETAWAAKVTKIRGFHNPNELTDFYNEVGKDFSEKLATLIENCPDSVTERTDILSRQLSQLNEVLPALSENNLGHLLYKSYVSFAEHVANAEGGFFGFFRIGKDEAKLIDLPMIVPVEWVEPSAEEE